MSAALPAPAPHLPQLHDALLGMVRHAEAPDLSARQLAVLLTLRLTGEPQTVRGLAKHLNIARPCITRALDRLAEHGFTQRTVDTSDRRSVLISMLPPANDFLALLQPEASA
jgi:DNA-binding MarR family transcriptional regulator